jgi:hypothetical protein
MRPEFQKVGVPTSVGFFKPRTYQDKVHEGLRLQPQKVERKTQKWKPLPYEENRNHERHEIPRKIKGSQARLDSTLGCRPTEFHAFHI